VVAPLSGLSHIRPDSDGRIDGQQPFLGLVAEGTFSTSTPIGRSPPSPQCDAELKVHGHGDDANAVLSGPTPARLSAADTFTFDGNPRMASRPSLRRSACLRSTPPSRCSAPRHRAPRPTPGRFARVSVTESTRPTAAPRTPSKPAIAPEGTRMLHPRSCAPQTIPGDSIGRRC